MKILTDIHMHTVASNHAYSTVHDYWNFSIDRGLQLFGLSDHAPDMPDGAHAWHFGNRKVLPRIYKNVAMLRGIEANIQPPGGGIDIPHNMLPYLDYVIASLHEPVFPPSSDRKANTTAVINTISSGKCQVLGHLGNPNYPIFYEEVVRAAKDNNVVIEINNSSFTHSRPGSKPNCVKLMELIEKLNWKVSFSSDSHSAFTVGEFTTSIDVAKSIGFPESKIVNATAKRFLSFLAEHGRPVASELNEWSKQFSE